MISIRHVFPICLAIAGLAAPPLASAEPLSKEQCIDAHGRGQDAREQGKLSLARKLFLTCAQSSCPALVQRDCARFTDDLMRQQSSLSFVARDAQGSDLPDTAVYVDDALVVTRLDDGKPHDVDPGTHTIRFTSNGNTQSVTVVVGTGEKGRVVSVTFSAINVPTPTAAAAARAATATPIDRTVTVHPREARYLLIGGGAATLAGAVLGVLGVRKVPASCSISTNHCAAPPGDPVFAQAHSGMQLADAGIVVGGIGVAALTGGLIWYYAKARTERTSEAAAIIPLVTPDGAGLAVHARF